MGNVIFNMKIIKYDGLVPKNMWGDFLIENGRLQRHF